MKYRHRLPQLDGDVFLTDGGLETVLIFHDGLELPAFAAFDLLKHEEGTEAVRRYYEPFLALARAQRLGFVLESPTWRASPRWGSSIGYGEPELDRANRAAIELMEDLRNHFEVDGAPIVISGCIGPQDDGYSPRTVLSATDAHDYHRTQIATFADTAADMVCALTMSYADEAVGVTRAAQEARMPVAISFTLETDGRLPSGQPLGEAVEQVDAETGAAPAYYMINCAHPTHFEDAISGDEPWRERIRGLRANASTRSHAELDEATELDDGDPEDLAARYMRLTARLPRLTVLGGCCGTDFRHVAAIQSAWFAGSGPGA